MFPLMMKKYMVEQYGGNDQISRQQKCCRFFMCILTKAPINDNSIIGNQIISDPMEGFTCRYVIQALTQDL